MKIIYVETDTMRQLFMKEAMKDLEVELFVVDRLEEEFYMFEDIIPDLVIFDPTTLGAHAGYEERTRALPELSATRFETLTNPISLEDVVKLVENR